MKKKDLFFLLLAVTIFLGTGYVGYTQLMPNKATPKVVTVEVVKAIPDKMDVKVVALLGDRTKVQNFNPPVDLSGLGNTAIFGR